MMALAGLPKICMEVMSYTVCLPKSGTLGGIYKRKCFKMLEDCV